MQAMPLVFKINQRFNAFGASGVSMREKGQGKGVRGVSTWFRFWGRIVGITAFALLTGCQRGEVPLRNLQVHQDWALQVGSQVAGYPISSGLGDITLDLDGDEIQMPFNGEIQPTQGDCVLLSSAEVPAYLFRLCGVQQAKLGLRSQDQPIGKADHLVFATLRKQPNGTWVLVEPSTEFIERLVGEG